jgi:hypothetical protein
MIACALAGLAPRGVLQDDPLFAGWRSVSIAIDGDLVLAIAGSTSKKPRRGHRSGKSPAKLKKETSAPAVHRKFDIAFRSSARSRFQHKTGASSAQFRAAVEC